MIQFEAEQELSLYVRIMDQILNCRDLCQCKRPAVHIQMELFDRRPDITLTCIGIHFIQIMVVLFKQIGVHDHIFGIAVVQSILQFPIG